MKIISITVSHVNLPLEHPYWLSGGRLKFEMLDAALVMVETDAGITGWGEGTPWGHTSVPAHGRGIRAGIEMMAPFVPGLDPRRVLKVERAMDLALPGHLYSPPHRHGLLGYCRAGGGHAHCRFDGRRFANTAPDCIVSGGENG